MDTLLGLLAFPLLLAVPVAYLAVQAKLLRRWVSGWRMAAALPLLGWAVWVATFAWDVSIDATSHNLLPFEILIGAGASLLYLGCLAVVRWAAQRSPLPRKGGNDDEEVSHQRQPPPM